MVTWLVCWDELAGCPAEFELKAGQEIVFEDQPQYITRNCTRRYVYVRTHGEAVRLIRNEKLSDGTTVPVLVDFKLDCPVCV
jgi:hypothetical protein